MKILIDSSVWINALSARPTIPELTFRDVLVNRRAVTIQPIAAEVLSGRLSPVHGNALRRSLGIVERVDPDWNAADSWTAIVDLADFAHRRGLSPLGVLDRMILVAADRSGSQLWTLDRKLTALAEAYGVPTLTK